MIASDLISYFPFSEIRPKQLSVLRNIADAVDSYKYIVLEAPTGFGKSAVAVTLARALGSCYICSATKDLQTQYTQDFPFLRSIKGMANFDCLVKEDLIFNNAYGCIECNISGDRNGGSVNDCKHTSVNYGGCRIKGSGLAHLAKNCDACLISKPGGREKFHDGCRYRTWEEDYQISDRNGINENIFIPVRTSEAYLRYATVIDREKKSGWMHLLNIDPSKVRSQFTPCGYYDQVNKGMIASHTIFNYANFLIFLRRTKVSPRKLLILDEGHQIESQIVEDIGISISSRLLRKFTGPDGAELLENSKCNYDSDMLEWLDLLGKIYRILETKIPVISSTEVQIDAEQYLQRLKDTIVAMEIDPANWVVSDIVDSFTENKKIQHRIIAADLANRKIYKVTFKPIDVAPYCTALLNHCHTTFIMSATILDIDTFCKNIGLDRNQTKFIEVGSDFPLENRPIYALNTAYLNYNSLQIPEIQRSLANAVDKIMDLHSNDKGIIHTTSYKQVEFLRHLISIKNRRRLLSTDPAIPRDEIIAKHWLEGSKGSVLISPSLHTGLDLKDKQSRFQILVKIPYPSKADRWIAKKLEVDGGRWYNWQTALRLVQACGRSIRSKDDWAKTYILDSAFDRFIRENNLPLWFREGIV